MAKKESKTSPEDTVEITEENKVTADKWQKIAEEDKVSSDEKKEQAKAGMKGRSAESVENELIDLRSKFAESEDKAVRIQAEMQNLRRRLERDMDNAYKFANEKIIGELLPVLDSLTRGIEAVSQDDPARQGMELTATMLREVMNKHGVKEVAPAVGDAFNPQQHEAMSMIPVEGAESNTVVEVLQSGCELNGRILRAAMVVVAK